MNSLKTLTLTCLFLCFSSFAAESSKSNFREARKSFEEWKTTNPKANEDIKKAKEFISELRDQMKMEKRFQGQTKEQRREQLKNLFHERLPDFTHSTVCESNGGESAVGWHALVYGQDEMDCDNGTETHLRTIGPGLASRPFEGTFVACANGVKGLNIGATAHAGFLMGVSTGLLFGAGGVCVLAGYGILDFGASAGLSWINFSRSDW